MFLPPKVLLFHFYEWFEFIFLFCSIYLSLTDKSLFKTFIVNPAEKDPFEANHFKFLSCWINPLLKKKIIKPNCCNFNQEQWACQELQSEWFHKTSVVPILCPLAARLALFNKEPWLEFWLKKNFKFGLGLTAITDHYQNMQSIKCQLFQKFQRPNNWCKSCMHQSTLKNWLENTF